MSSFIFLFSIRLEEIFQGVVSLGFLLPSVVNSAKRHKNIIIQALNDIKTTQHTRYFDRTGIFFQESGSDVNQYGTEIPAKTKLLRKFGTEAVHYKKVFTPLLLFLVILNCSQSSSWWKHLSNQTIINPLTLTLITANKPLFDCQSVFYNAVAEFGFTLFKYLTAQKSAHLKESSGLLGSLKTDVKVTAERPWAEKMN